MTTIRGTCLCGGVKFEITGPLSSPLNCHCSLCRKQHAAPFRSRARAQVKDFRWLQGENLVKYYETPGGYQRGFCRECGSPILNRTAPNSKRAAQSPQSLSQYGIPLALSIPRFGNHCGDELSVNRKRTIGAPTVIGIRTEKGAYDESNVCDGAGNADVVRAGRRVFSFFSEDFGTL